MTFWGTNDECFGTEIPGFKPEFKFDYATVASDVAEVLGGDNHAGSETADRETGR